VTGPPRTPADPGAGGAYTAYSYLAAGEGFRRFELAPEFGRVAPYAAGLTAEQERRARRLLGPAGRLGRPLTARAVGAAAAAIPGLSDKDLTVEV
jgi:hypothetical protein